MPYLHYRIINRHSTAISDRVRSVTLVAPLQQHSAHVIFLDELPAGVERMVASRTNTLSFFIAREAISYMFRRHFREEHPQGTV